MEQQQPKKQHIDWRRNRVLELSSQGHSEREIAQTLQVGSGTIHRDLEYLRKQAQANLKSHIQERLPEQYQRCMVGMNQILKICWDIINKHASDDKTRLQASTTANDCYKYIMDLTTNGVVITDAIKFVQTSKEKLTMSTKEENNDNKESKEPDYNDNEDEQEKEETRESTTTTMNQTF